jgi:serine/threonine-protein kinase
VVQVLDKLMAPKPGDRYANAAEAAKALQALLRPRTKSSVSSASGPIAQSNAAQKPITADSAAARESAPPKPVPPTYIKVRPNYPSWFRPLANLAEKNPALLILATLATLATTFMAGIGVGWILK